MRLHKMPLGRLRAAPRVLAAAAVCAAALPGLAALAQEGAVESLGAQPCRDLIEARDTQSPAYLAFAAWVGGYLTAANAYEPETYDLTPWQPIEAAIAQVAQACAASPEAPVARVVSRYVTFLRPDRLAERSDLVQLNNGQQAVFVYKSVLAEVRAKLVESGAEITDPEGSFGQSFGEAILSFQGRAGLTGTGLLDLPTLVALYR